MVDEFGDWNTTGTLDTRNSSPDDIELQDRHSYNTGQIDLDEFPWAGRSFGELENRSQEIESQNSGKHSFPHFTTRFLDAMCWLEIVYRASCQSVNMIYYRSEIVTFVENINVNWCCLIEIRGCAIIYYRHHVARIDIF
jgi:hypothetical protein